MNLGIKGKVAIVTGSGRGIGEQIAKTLAEEGAKVVINDLDMDRANKVVEEIKKAGGEAIAVVADVTKQEQVNAMVSKALEKWGTVDIMVNNAGVPVGASTLGSTFVDTPVSEWNRFIDINLYGAMYCCRAVIEPMMKKKSGKIVNIISEAGRIGEARQAPYSGAKSGVLGFSKAIARELGKYRINVNCIAAAATFHEGVVENMKALGLTDEQIKEAPKNLYGSYPLAKGLDRAGLPSDIADAVAFLASDRAQWITGQVLSVSGGYTMVG